MKEIKPLTSLRALAALLILALTVPGGSVYRLLSWAPLVFPGKVSYGFYLVQLTVMMKPLLAVADRAGPLAYMPVLLGLTGAFCSIVYRIVEVPARRFIVARFGGGG